MDVTTGIVVARNGFKFVKDLRESLRAEKVDPLEVSNRLTEIQELLLELQEALSDAKTENLRLEAEIRTRDDQAAIQADLEFVTDGGFFVRKSERSVSGLAIPYCPICWDKDHELVHLKSFTDVGIFKCILHTTVFETSDYRRAMKLKQATVRTLR